MDKQNDPIPVNLKPADGNSEYSGFIIVRLSNLVSSNQVASDDRSELREIAKTPQCQGLAQLLNTYYNVQTRPLVHAISSQQLLELEQRAATSPFPPLRSLTSYWRFDCRNLTDDKKAELLHALNELPEVDLAYQESSVNDPSIRNPCTDPCSGDRMVNDADDPLAVNQGYLNAAPEGIDARWAWTQPCGRGAGVGFIDLEQGWFPNHEDLIAKTPTLIFNDNRDGVGGYKGDHGTAVLGEVVGVDNTIGVIGIAPEVTSVRMVSHYDVASNTALHVADAILAAIAMMNPGDVLLLEVQRNYLPTETDPADFDAIRLAVALGIIVVEAAGNGDSDLDSWTDPMGQRLLNRNDVAFADSGAIMVGSSVSTVPHDRYVGCGVGCGSNYGSRIDCYGWGENITTAGYGFDGTIPDNSTYTNNFGGTSGASPMITGAALILQGMYEAVNGIRLSPSQMRILLSNAATGTPQGGGVPGSIGVMPNLRAIITTHPGFKKNCEILVPITLKIPVYIEPVVTATAPECHNGHTPYPPEPIAPEPITASMKPPMPET